MGQAMTVVISSLKFVKGLVYCLSLLRIFIVHSLSSHMGLLSHYATGGGARQVSIGSTW